MQIVTDPSFLQRRKEERYPLSRKWQQTGCEITDILELNNAYEIQELNNGKIRFLDEICLDEMSQPLFGFPKKQSTKYSNNCIPSGSFCKSSRNVYKVCHGKCRRICSWWERIEPHSKLPHLKPNET